MSFLAETENVRRFTQNHTWQKVHEFLSVFSAPRNLRPRCNIASRLSFSTLRCMA